MHRSREEGLGRLRRDRLAGTIGGGSLVEEGQDGVVEGVVGGVDLAPAPAFGFSMSPSG